jgi:catalase
LAAHPIAKAFLTFTTPPPVSFGTLTYFGINAFKFTDSKGIVRYGRNLFRPWAGGVRYLPMSAAPRLSPNYLVDEIHKRVGKAPVFFSFYVQVADKGDDISNPTIAWPKTRRLVKMGTVVIRSVVADTLTANDVTLFADVRPGRDRAGGSDDRDSHRRVRRFIWSSIICSERARELM